MGIFDEGKKLEKDAERIAREHPQQADRAIGEAEKLAERGTGGRFDSQIEDAGRRAEQYLGKDQPGEGSAADKNEVP